MKLNEGPFLDIIKGKNTKDISKFKNNIERNILPALNQFGIKINPATLNQKNTELDYSGLVDGEPVGISFSTADQRKDKDKDLLYTIYYNNLAEPAASVNANEIGTILRSTQNTLNKLKNIDNKNTNNNTEKQPDENVEKLNSISNSPDNEPPEKSQPGDTQDNHGLPPKDLLNHDEGTKSVDKDELDRMSNLLVEVLESFDIHCKVEDIKVGPSVTQFQISLQAGTKVASVKNLDKEISMALSAKEVRIQAPIPGTSYVGIEIPNKEITAVNLANVLENTEKRGLSVALGVDVEGNPHQADILKMNHLLIGGSTGSGKSACINSFLTSLLMQYTADQVRLVLIDPKQVEMTSYKGIPHLLRPVITNPEDAVAALQELVDIMQDRYSIFAAVKVRNIEGYNNKVEKYNAQNPKDKMKYMYYIVCVIDELADLMIASKNSVEQSIQRITQLARAAGIHLIVATQRPSADVVTGVIKANIPSRISFAVPTNTDSRIILDQGGAEKLLGKGDMLYKPQGSATATRLQGAYTSDEEVERVTDYVRGGKE